MHLNCNLEECIRRDSKNVYLPVIEKKKKFAVGIDIQFDEPKNSDLNLHSDKDTAEILVEKMWKKISSNIFDNQL